jgi:cysteine desulfurase
MITSNNKIYLDYNATTPVDNRVAETVHRVMLECWGNPGSGHEEGKKAAEVFENARSQVAGLINASPEEVLFTSGGTESNNMVLYGVASALQEKGKHIIVSKIEHPAILAPCMMLEQSGCEITMLDVNEHGLVDIEQLEHSVRPSTVLVSIMLANNETGVIQPLEDIATLCKKKGVLLHSDGAQAVGKICVDVKRLGVDFMTIAGHKLYAPKGIGALYIREGVDIVPLMDGGGQQGGIRPGTEPVPLAAGLGVACMMAQNGLEKEIERQRRLREYFFSLLQKGCGTVYRYSDGAETLPNTLCVSFPGIRGADLLASVDGVMASTGAACHDRKVQVSHVVDAMGVPYEVATGTVRFSIGKFTDESQIVDAAARVVEAVRGYGKR